MRRAPRHAAAAAAAGWPVPAFALLIALAPGIGVTAAAADLPGLDSARIDTAFAAHARDGAPGCSTGIVVDGRLEWSKGYGLANLEHAVPNGPATVFDLGSTSKQVTAAAIALLARDGLLSLDDDVRRHLPEIPDYGRRITIRHLLTHTSGLRDYTDLLGFSGHREEDLTTTAGALAILARQGGVNFAPGAEFRYCNSGFFLASLIVERVSGKSLRTFAQERLFGPLGMTHTLFLDDHALVVPRRAQGYAPRPGGGYAVAASDWEQTGDGAVQSSVEDMARWAALFDVAVGGSPSAGDGDRAGAGALPAAWLRQTLETPGRLADGTVLRYGLGLFLDTHRGLGLVQHGGAWAGFRAMLMRVPERRLAVITLCNTADADTSALSFAALDAALDALPDPPPPVAPPPAPAAGAPAAGAALAGTYYSEPLGEVLRVALEGGTLRLEGSGPAVTLSADGERRFTARDGRLAVTFAADGSGLSLHAAGDGDPRPAAYRRARDAGHPPAGSLRGLAGLYASEELGPPWTIRVRDGVPRVLLPGGESFDLHPLARDLFDAEWGIVRLRRDANGRPAAITFTNRGVVNLRLRRVAAPPAGAAAGSGGAP